ncbi:hypothetical protein [Nocardia sp. NPDC050710]
MTSNSDPNRLPDHADIAIGAVTVSPTLCRTGQMTIVGCGLTFTGGA